MDIIFSYQEYHMIFVASAPKVIVIAVKIHLSEHWTSLLCIEILFCISTGKVLKIVTTER